MSSDDRHSLESLKTPSDNSVGEALVHKEILEVVHFRNGTEGVLFAIRVLGNEQVIVITSDFPGCVVTHKDVRLKGVSHS